MENSNQVFETPQANLTLPKQIKLYNLAGITIATFVGSIFAGGLFMSINFGRMGKQKEASTTLLYTILASIVIFALLFMIPDDVNIPSIVYVIPQIFAMRKIAEHYQKEDLDKHDKAGGEFVSNWITFGYSVLICLGIIAIAFGMILAFSS